MALVREMDDITFISRQKILFEPAAGISTQGTQKLLYTWISAKVYVERGICLSRKFEVTRNPQYNEYNSSNRVTHLV